MKSEAQVGHFVPLFPELLALSWGERCAILFGVAIGDIRWFCDPTSKWYWVVRNISSCCIESTFLCLSIHPPQPPFSTVFCFEEFALDYWMTQWPKSEVHCKSEDTTAQGGGSLLSDMSQEETLISMTTEHKCSQGNWWVSRKRVQAGTVHIFLNKGVIFFLHLWCDQKCRNKITMSSICFLPFCCTCGQKTCLLLFWQIAMPGNQVETWHHINWKWPTHQLTRWWQSMWCQAFLGF